MTRGLLLLAISLLPILTLGCRRDMFNQPRYNPLSSSDFFTNASSGNELNSETKLTLPTYQILPQSRDAAFHPAVSVFSSITWLPHT